MGYSEIDSATTVTHAFLWDRQSGLRDLGSFGGSDCEARAVNDSAQVVGLAWTAQGHEVAFIWTAKAGLQPLQSFGANAEAHSINLRGEITGVIGVQPVRWARFDAPPRNLGYVLVQGSPVTVNDAGLIAGTSDLPGQGQYNEAVIWKPDSTLVPLGVWSAAGSAAESMNSLGEVVGNSAHGLFDSQVAVLWDQQHNMIDLNTVVTPQWSLVDASGINDNGDITGLGYCGDSYQVYVLWYAGPSGVPGSSRGGRSDPNGPAAGGAPADRARGLVRVLPDPASGPVGLRFENSIPGDVGITILDPAGRVLDRLDRWEPAGVVSLSWDPGSGQAGLRFFRVTLPDGRVANGKGMFLRR